MGETAAGIDFEPQTTERFVVRTLEESDVTKRYVEWFDDEMVQRFIVSARTGKQSIESLRAYVGQKRADRQALMLGLFEKPSGPLVGTLKFEPIDFGLGAAAVGVMIGEPGWRAKGVFAEVFAAAAGFLRDRYGIRHYRVGVETENEPAIRAYRKCGFTETTPHPVRPTVHFQNQIFLFFSLPPTVRADTGGS